MRGRRRVLRLVSIVLVPAAAALLAACGQAGPYTTTVYTLTPIDASHLGVSVAIFNGGNSPGSPSCRLTASSAGGPGTIDFVPPGPIGVAKSVVVHETVSIPAGAAASVGYRDVAVSCS